MRIPNRSDSGNDVSSGGSWAVFESRAWAGPSARDRRRRHLDGDPRRRLLVLLGPSAAVDDAPADDRRLLEPTSGRIVLDGEDITSAPARKRDVAMVFQNYALYPHLSVARNLGFPLRVRKVPKEEAATGSTRWRSNSRSRTCWTASPRAVGRPSSARRGRARDRAQPQGVPDGRAAVEPRREAADGHPSRAHRAAPAPRRTFVYVTHDQVEAMTMATRIALLNRGAVEQIGTPEEVYDRPRRCSSPAPRQSRDEPPRRNRPDIRGTVRAEAPGLRCRPVGRHHRGLDVVLGIRPEHLRTGTGAEDVSLTATVDSVENLAARRSRTAPSATPPCASGRRGRSRCAPASPSPSPPIPNTYTSSTARASPARVDRHLAALRLPRLFR